ncbi:MAG: hypothetical protein AMXMBFR33_23320 [Candidatus Xenobia bacterium]
MRWIALLALLLPCALATEADYFPVGSGLSWVYQFKGRQSFDYTVEVVKTEGNRALVRTTMPQVLTQEWYEVGSGGISLTGMEDPDGERALYQPPRPYLRFPMKPGTSWTWTGRLGRSSEITDSNRILASAQVKVPAGTFTCLVVETLTTQSGGTLNQTSYYASGVGLVKYVSESPAGNWVTVLKSWSGSSPKP